ncbi:hypothetical protein [Pseudomonas putida]
MEVDIVPVILNPITEGYGWQFDLTDGTKTETCAPCQMKFVKDRNDEDLDFRTLMRMARQWPS